MSCSCGNNCASGCGCYLVTLPDNPVVGYSAANINLAGIGVYDSTAGTEFDFKGIVSATVALTVTDNPINHTIVLTLDIPSIINDLPQATTTQIGVGETATDAEAIAKASITTFLTPSNLAALGSSTVFAGLVELATNAETQAGVSATLAVTPAGLASVTALLQGTVTWTDSVTRAAATPDFDGQLGVQLDTNIAWIASGAAAGDFDVPVMTLDSVLNVMTSSTSLDLNSLTFTFFNGDLVYQGGGAFFDNGQTRFGTTASLDFDFGAQCRVFAASVIVPANSVFITTGTAGEVSSSLINTFVSNANVQTYGLPTSVLARTTFATYGGQVISNPPTQAEVQALDDAVVIVSQRLGALITDLMATLKPHA